MGIIKIKLLNNAGFKKYFYNTSWLIVEKIVRFSVVLIVGVWFTRFLGPENFGIFSYARSFVGLFAIFATLGIDAIVIRELVNNNKIEKPMLGTVFSLKLIGAFFLIFILMVFMYFREDTESINLLILIIASGAFFQSFNVIDFFFQSKVLSKFTVYSNLITIITCSILKALFIFLEADLVSFAWLILFESALLSYWLIFFYKKMDFSIFKWKFHYEMAISLLKESWPLMLSGLVISFYMRIDQVMLKDMIGEFAVGQYAAAVRLSEAWFFIPFAITTSLFPAIIKAKNKSLELYYTRLKQLYSFLIWFAILISIPLTYFSDSIVFFIYGNDFYEVASILAIQIWAGVFVSISAITGKHIVIMNMQKITLLVTFLGALINIVLNILLINRYGAIGAAYSTFISYFLVNYLFLFLFKPLRNIFYLINKSLVSLKGFN